MKTKVLSFVLIVYLSVSVSAQIINVPDDYPTIQTAIGAASNGDTVLVDTGIYIENIKIGGDKRLTIASRYLINNDRSFIYNTIIDGNKSGSTVSYECNSPNSIPQVLCGFVIQNGSGGSIGEGPQPIRGGGIRCEGAGNAVLRNLIVQNNDGKDYGGGIYIAKNDTVILKDVTIRHNKAAHGGGLYGYAIFDTIGLCNVYSNQAIVGADFNGGFFTNDVHLDTFSVSYPTGYYASPLNNFNFQINTGLIEQIDADLFVSPDGDNNNSGLSKQSPLKSINYAFSKLKTDSLSPHTVHLLEGAYHTENNNTFPVCIPQYVKLIGTNKNEVILDGGGENGINLDFEGYNSVIMFSWNSNTLLSDVSITGGRGSAEYEGIIKGGGIYCSKANPVIQDVIISGNIADEGGGLYIYGNQSQDAPTLERVWVKENSAIWGGGISMYYSAPNIINSVIESNYSDTISGWGWPHGGGVYCCSSNPKFINSTIVNNIALGGDEGGGIYLIFSSNLEIINSIIWNNQPQEIISGYSNNNISISYSNLKGGFNGIVSNNGNDTIIWLDGNIDQDPLFTGSVDHPYSLQEGSPCIDKGKPDTTGLSIGMYDLMGNYRLWDGDLDGETIIDMGAYEFGSIGTRVPESFASSQQSAVIVYPNPFITSTTMSYTLSEPSTVSVRIFNPQGQLIERIEQEQQGGEQQFQWNAEGLPAGMYYLTISDNSGRTESGKLLKY